MGNEPLLEKIRVLLREGILMLMFTTIMPFLLIMLVMAWLFEEKSGPDLQHKWKHRI
jgi:hypothetical protein